MKKYNMIDTRERNAVEELKEYTLDELCNYFLVDDEEYSNAEKLEEVKDIDDLIELLTEEADGMEMPYIFEEA